MGLSLMRQKFIMEPENSPFRGKDKLSRSAKRLWQYLVHQSEQRDTILQYLYTKKSHVSVWNACTRASSNMTCVRTH